MIHILRKVKGLLLGGFISIKVERYHLNGRSDVYVYMYMVLNFFHTYNHTWDFLGYDGILEIKNTSCISPNHSYMVSHFPNITYWIFRDTYVDIS